MKLKGLTQDQYKELEDVGGGYCTTCDSEQFDCFCEPDVSEAQCPECGNKTLMGAGEALLRGYVH